MYLENYNGLYHLQFACLALWAAAFGISLALVYGIDVQGTLNGTTEELSEFARVSYDTFQHLGWGLAMTWLIFACQHGYGGSVTTH